MNKKKKYYGKTIKILDRCDVCGSITYKHEDRKLGGVNIEEAFILDYCETIFRFRHVECLKKLNKDEENVQQTGN